MQSPFASRRALFGSLAVVAVAAVGLTSLASNSSSAAKNGGAQVRMLDDCDPATFNLDPPAGPGAGTCVGDGDVTFLQLLAAAATGGHPEWRFKDATVQMKAGTSLRVENRGGEHHSFTEVSQFGAGPLAPLNAGIPETTLAVPLDTTIDPTNLAAIPTIAPRGSATISGLAPGTHMFQCLIHPWMRSIVTVS